MPEIPSTRVTRHKRARIRRNVIIVVSTISGLVLLIYYLFFMPA